MCPIKSPKYSSGAVISTDIIGSKITAPAFLAAARRAIEAATLNAVSLESTSW